MDWGLLDSNAGENRFLREEVVYSAAVSKIIIINNNIELQIYILYVSVVLLFRNNRRFYTTIYMDCEFYPR